jgi:hypothetical protein
MWYTFWMTNRWLLLNFDALGALAVLVTTLFSIATLADGDSGLAGLCITSAMAFTSSGIPNIRLCFFSWLIYPLSVYWACRFWTGMVVFSSSCPWWLTFVFSFGIRP